MGTNKGPEIAQIAQPKALKEGPSTRAMIREVVAKFSSTSVFKLLQEISAKVSPAKEDVQKADKTLAQFQAETTAANNNVAANYFTQYRDGLKRDYPEAFTEA